MIRFIAGISTGLIVACMATVFAFMISHPSDEESIYGLCESRYDYTDFLTGSVVARAVPEAVFQMSPSISDADFSSKSYQIVFPKKEPEGNWSLYLMRLNSGEPDRLTNSDQTDWYPNWSPNGDEVVFTRRVPGTDRSSIYVINVESGVERQIISPPKDFADKFAYWSLDGERLVFIREDISETFGKHQLFLVNPDGSNMTEIHLGEGHFEVELMPQWSPDRQSMVFATRQVHDPEISRSGSVTMRSSDDEPFLVLADVDGSNQRVIAHYPPSNVASFEKARFSEDGSKVIYTARNTDGRGERSYVDLGSGDIRHLDQVCK